MSALRIIITGQMAQYPLGGVTWYYLQYLLGLAALGHDVYYIEDSGQWPYNPRTQELPEQADFNVEYLSGVMARFDLGARWAYLFPWESQWFGMSDRARTELIRTADLLINVSGTLRAPQEYREVLRLAYVDSDPVFTQIKLLRGQKDFRALVDAHDVHFSYGELIADALPDTGHDWKPTRAPVTLSEWDPDSRAGDRYTTITNWTAFTMIDLDGREYGQKDVEFRRFLDLPSMVEPTVTLELAIGPGNKAKTPHDLLKHKGWQIVDPNVVCPDLDSLRNYVEGSRGEWSVAKHGYVQGQSGWFSERSARYLAAGKPTILQDTGFSRVFPVGDGLLAFTSMEEAAEALAKVEADHDQHRRAAREIAEEYFDAEVVLRDLVERAMR